MIPVSEPPSLGCVGWILVLPVVVALLLLLLD